MKLLTEFCIISNYSKRSVFWTPCSTNLVIILIYGIALSSVLNCGSIHVADSCCVFHCGDGSSDGTIVPFVDHTLDNCRTVLSRRKVKNLKYKEVILPENLNNKKTGYHAECYRKFTALGRNAPPKNDDVESKSVHTRSKRTLASASSSTGIMPKISIVCIKKDKKHNGSKQKLISVETGDFEEKIKKYVTTLGDQTLLSKLGSVDFVAKEVRYHGMCRTKYQTPAEQVSKTSQNKEAAKRFNQSLAQRKRGSF